MHNRLPYLLYSTTNPKSFQDHNEFMYLGWASINRCKESADDWSKTDYLPVICFISSDRGIDNLLVILSSCLLLVCTVSQSHLHDYQHFADLGTMMVWCGLDGGGGSGGLSVGRLFLKFD